MAYYDIDIVGFLMGTLPEGAEGSPRGRIPG